jgi:hypothetical protein
LQFLKYDSKLIKKEIEKSSNDKYDLIFYSKMATKSSQDICKIKKDIDKELNDLELKLETKYKALIFFHQICLEIIKLLDHLLFYIKKSIGKCNLYFSTFDVRNQLADLANFDKI